MARGKSPTDVVIEVTNAKDEKFVGLMWRCAGCGDPHFCQVKGKAEGASWAWNGSLTAPTLSPSVLKAVEGGATQRCHSFVREGVVQFLSDCDHELAGQHKQMLPENASPFGREPG